MYSLYFRMCAALGYKMTKKLSSVATMLIVTRLHILVNGNGVHVTRTMKNAVALGVLIMPMTKVLTTSVGIFSFRAFNTIQHSIQLCSIKEETKAANNM